MAKHSIGLRVNIQFWKDLINIERCEMLTCNCFAMFEISKYRKNSLSKLSAWSFLNRLEVEQAACIKSRISWKSTGCNNPDLLRRESSSWHCGKLEDGKSSVPKIELESARPEGHWVPGRRHHSVNLNPPGTESIVYSPVRPLHGPARSELQVAWLADSRVNLNLPARRRRGRRALSAWSYPAAPPPPSPWPSGPVEQWLADSLANTRLAPANHVVDPFQRVAALVCYEHIRTYTYIYIHIHAYTYRSCIYIHCMKSTIFY
jgi:hypothetical protein